MDDLIMSECNHPIRKIYFNNEKAKAQLLEHGLVYTLRRPSFYHNGIELAISGKQELGKVKVTFVKEIIDTMELLPYVESSGFQTIKEWSDIAFMLHPGLKSYYMFLVQVYNEGV